MTTSRSRWALPAAPPPALRALLRHRAVLLWLAVAVPALVCLWGGWVPGDWVFFSQGADVLLGRGEVAPWQLYAAHPDVQIGPVPLLLTAPLTLLPPAVGGVLACALVAALLPLTCRWLELLGEHWRGPSPWRPATTFVGGLFAAIWWWRLGGEFAHPDDALVVAGGVAGLLVGARGRPLLGSVLLGLAVSGKPWAVGLLVLALAFGGRARWRRLLLAGAAALAPWAPFVLLDPATLLALSGYRVAVWSSAPLALLGLAEEPVPGWVRPVQFLLALGVVALAVAVGRADLGPFLAVAARLALEPQAWDYYFASLVVAALVADVLRRRAAGPWLTIGTVLVLYDVRWLVDDRSVMGAMLLLPLLAGVVLLLPDIGARLRLWTSPGGGRAPAGAAA
ncbi:hypothetical protein [Kineococcus terrestris]|uniref:hypothetical protein n=1 Tax=Kineococcus terrestris TaxID=2044856 RepID=UPI0034DB2BAC